MDLVVTPRVPRRVRVTGVQREHLDVGLLAQVVFMVASESDNSVDAALSPKDTNNTADGENRDDE